MTNILLRFDLNNVSDPQICESYGVAFGVSNLFVDWLWDKEVELLELFLHLSFLHIYIIIEDIINQYESL